jgi:hypothetical protein
MAKDHNKLNQNIVQNEMTTDGNIERADKHGRQEHLGVYYI